jgi:acetylornithine deacetylase/succinyl-diaminopimelate desuccinylase-like protein
MGTAPSHLIDDAGITAFLTELVRTPSVNPPGNEGPVAEWPMNPSISTASPGLRASTSH